MDSHSGSDFSHSDFGGHAHHDAGSFGHSHQNSGSHHHAHHSDHTHQAAPESAPSVTIDDPSPGSMFTTWSDPAPRRRVRGSSSRSEQFLGGLVTVIFSIGFVSVALWMAGRQRSVFPGMGPPLIFHFTFVAIGAIVGIKGLLTMAKSFTPASDFDQSPVQPLNLPRPSPLEDRPTPRPPPTKPCARMVVCPGCGARPRAAEITCNYCGGTLLKDGLAP